MQHRVASVDDIPPGGSLAIDVGEKRIAIFHYGGNFYALDETCPHRGAPLHEGRVDRGIVTCSWHQWQFDLKTGCSPVNPLSKVRTYPLRVEDGGIWIDVEI